ncbi:MAG TPA: hypothetical protein VFE78_23125 [Gemmataceae bacterium]|jgi:hypothetical protein|nr:hypothetical protein [Gemmataceae bacterium]
MRETLTSPAADALWEVRPPVLLNTWKHHAGALRRRIAGAVRDGAAGLAALADGMVVIGTELMDLYVGRFTPAEIAAKVVARLQADGLLAPDAYRAWVAAEGGYRLLTFAEDDSVWVLRAGDEGRYVHVHPARWAPATLRVRANVLKTAALALAYAAVHGGDPMGRALLNRVRADYLGLSPVGRDPAGEQGVGRVIDLLRAGPQ